MCASSATVAEAGINMPASATEGRAGAIRQKNYRGSWSKGDGPRLRNPDFSTAGAGVGHRHAALIARAFGDDVRRRAVEKSGLRRSRTISFDHDPVIFLTAMPWIPTIPKDRRSPRSRVDPLGL